MEDMRLTLGQPLGLSDRTKVGFSRFHQVVTIGSQDFWSTDLHDLADTLGMPKFVGRKFVAGVAKCIGEPSSPSQERTDRQLQAKATTKAATKTSGSDDTVKKSMMRSGYVGFAVQRKKAMVSLGMNGEVKLMTAGSGTAGLTIDAKETQVDADLYISGKLTVAGKEVASTKMNNLPIGAKCGEGLQNSDNGKCIPYTCTTGTKGTACKSCVPQSARRMKNHCAGCNKGMMVMDGVCVPSKENAVYVQWGRNSCTGGGATQLYKGFMAGCYYGQNGSGSNFLCMHPQPQYPNGHSNGNQNGGLLYGTEYENQGTSLGNRNHDRDAGCSVCLTLGHRQVYVQWGRSASCSNGHVTMYNGLVMSAHHGHKKHQWVCVDYQRDWHGRNSNGNQNGALIYATEMEGGSADESQYPHNREIGCSVCGVPSGSGGAVFVRWGRNTCGSAKQLYKGFMASSHHGHWGSGAQWLCMHPNPQYPPGHSNGNQDTSLMYGTEYQNQGTSLGNRNHDRDCGCSVCQTENKQVYVQWGRSSNCAHGHRTEYNGLVMADYHGHMPHYWLCVDYQRDYHMRNSNGNQDGALLYATEMEGGSSDESQYPHNREVGCSVCSTSDEGAVYTRWGHKSCPGGSKKLWDGFTAGSHHGHRGDGSNFLCMHDSPQYPPGHSNGNQNAALLYGTEYENQGTSIGNRNHNRDSACVVCQHQSSNTVYVQWGRSNTCSHGHLKVYSGLVMSSYYTHISKYEYTCFDYERQWHKRNSNGNQNGALVYATEMEGGAADESQYPHDREVGCIVCAIP